MLVVLRTASCNRWCCCTCTVTVSTGYVSYDLLTVTPFFVLNPRNYLPFTSIVETDCSPVCIFCFVFWYMCLCVRVHVLIRMSSKGWRSGKEKLCRSHCRVLCVESQTGTLIFFLNCFRRPTLTLATSTSITLSRSITWSTRKNWNLWWVETGKKHWNMQKWNINNARKKLKV